MVKRLPISCLFTLMNMGVGHQSTCNIGDILMNFQLMLFEEIKPNMLERIEDLDRPLEHVLEELMDGDIIVFQKELNGDEDYRLPTSKEYFRDLFYKVHFKCIRNRLSLALEHK